MTQTQKGRERTECAILFRKENAVCYLTLVVVVPEIKRYKCTKVSALGQLRMCISNYSASGSGRSLSIMHVQPCQASSRTAVFNREPERKTEYHLYNHLTVLYTFPHSVVGFVPMPLNRRISFRASSNVTSSSLLLPSDVLIDSLKPKSASSLS